MPSDLTPYDVLSSWMAGAGPGHPLNRSTFPAYFLGPLNEILETLEQSPPLRIVQKKKVFRRIDALDTLLEQRAELLAASLLARAEVDFEFAKDHPDFVLTGNLGGIEVGTRKLDNPSDIHDQLELRLSGSLDLQIILTFDGRPLKIGTERVAQIVREVLDQSNQVPPTNLRFDDVGLTVGIGTGTGVTTSVNMNFGATSGSDLSAHFAEIDREIDNKIAEKQHQADKISTVLLLDISRTGWAWLRSNPVWVAVLGSKLEGQLFVGLGVMTSTLASSLPLHMSVVLDPAAPPAIHEAIDRIAEASRLHVEP